MASIIFHVIPFFDFVKMPRRERRSREVAVDFVDVNNKYSAFIVAIRQISVLSAFYCTIIFIVLCGKLVRLTVI